MRQYLLLFTLGVIVGYYLLFLNVKLVREMYSSPAEVKAVGILFDDYEQNEGISFNRILDVKNIKDKESDVETSIYEIKYNVYNKDTSNLDIYIATVDINNNKVEDIIGFKDLILSLIHI